jgi:uncharacterized protein
VAERSVVVGSREKSATILCAGPWEVWPCQGSLGCVRELDVVGVRVEMPSNQPIVLLREVGGNRYLPIWIGAVEATAIAFAQQGVVPPRPLTHDLFKDVLEAMGTALEQVRITEVRDGTYYAELVFSGGVEVSSRPSDSIALALRTGSPIYAEDMLLEEAGVLMADGDSDSDEVSEDEVAKFREFLDQVSPEDFHGQPPER